MNIRQQTQLRSALLVQAERKLAESTTRNDWIVVFVCLGGLIILGVFA
jgi:hypothetical protein